MTEWWSYELSNFLLFSPETYMRLVEGYNEAMWPWHVAALLSGIALILLAALNESRRARLTTTFLLATAWGWVAWAFHLERYTPINFAAKWFGVAFIAQAVLLIATELVTRIEPRRIVRPVRTSGLAIAIFALAILPLIERLLGRSWSQVETFGLFPDATAILTLGVLLARERLDWHLFVIPLAWCLIGSATLRALGRPDAPVAVGAAVFATGLLGWKTVATRRSGAEQE